MDIMAISPTSSETLPVDWRWLGHGAPGAHLDEPTLHGEGPDYTHIYMYIMGVSINGVYPKYGWFIMDNPSINGWFGGTPISGNLHIYII